MVKHASGLSVLPAPLYPDEAEKITVNDVQAVLDVVQSGYDYVVVDTPPFFEERILIALDWADHVLLIASLDIPERQAPEDGVQDHGPHGLPRGEAPHRHEPGGLEGGTGRVRGREAPGPARSRRPYRAPSRCPGPSTPARSCLLSKPGSKVSRELAEPGEVVR